MTRVLPLLILIAVAAAFAPTAEAATCRSGHTVYKKQGVRVFYTSDAEDNDTYYACTPRTRRPVRLEIVSATYSGLGVFGRRGDKVLWETSTSGEGGGDYATVGWFDVRTAETRTGALVGVVSNAVVDMVVAKDGGIAVAVATDEDDQGVRVGYLARGPRRGKLRGEQALAIAGGG